MTNAANDVLAERARQKRGEGWTIEHDDSHSNGEMARAAACYALNSQSFWPWDATWWKPKDARRNYVRAAALLIAEIERLDRAHPVTSQAAPTADTGEPDYKLLYLGLKAHWDELERQLDDYGVPRTSETYQKAHAAGILHDPNYGPQERIKLLRDKLAEAEARAAALQAIADAARHHAPRQIGNVAADQFGTTNKCFTCGGTSGYRPGQVNHKTDCWVGALEVYDATRPAQHQGDGNG